MIPQIAYETLIKNNNSYRIQYIYSAPLVIRENKVFIIYSDLATNISKGVDLFTKFDAEKN